MTTMPNQGREVTAMETPEELVIRFSILPVTCASKALCEQLFELQGDALKDALACLVRKHPAVVGAAYIDPGELYWRDDEDALRHGGDNPTCREHAQEAYEIWAKEHGMPRPKWPEALDLIDSFGLAGVNPVTNGVYDMLLELTGEDLRDMVHRAVTKYPSMVGAAYENPDAPAWHPVDYEEAIERIPTKREQAREAYVQWSTRQAERADARSKLYRRTPDWASEVQLPQPQAKGNV